MSCLIYIKFLKVPVYTKVGEHTGLPGSFLDDFLTFVGMANVKAAPKIIDTGGGFILEEEEEEGGEG